MEFLSGDPGDEHQQPAESAEQLPAVVEKPKATLADLLKDLTSLERLMDDESFDPASVVGDIAANREDLAKKVDSIDYVVSEFEAYAARTQARADNFIRRAATAKRRAKGLREYLFMQMRLHGFDKLAGVERVAEIKRHHTPSVLPNRPATEDDLLNYGERFVSVVPRSYEWNNKAVKEAVLTSMEEQIPLDGFDFVNVKYDEKIVFDDRDRPEVKPTKKGKKK